MGMREFYWKWVKYAFRGKILWADSIAGLLTLFAVPVATLWDPEGGVVNWLPLAIFGAIFVGILVFGFVTAPYWMTKEVTDERDELIAARDGAMSALWDLRKEGVGLRNEFVPDISSFQDWNQRFNEWHSRTLAEAENLSQSFKHMLDPLNSIRPVPHDLGVRGFVCEEHRLHVSIINEMLERMEDRMKGS